MRVLWQRSYVYVNVDVSPCNQCHQSVINGIVQAYRPYIGPDYAKYKKIEVNLKKITWLQKLKDLWDVGNSYKNTE